MFTQTFSRIAVGAIAVIGAAAGGAVGLAQSAAAQGYQWQASAYNDEANKGRLTAHLTHGVPETDDRIFQSTCSPGSSARFATTIMGYDVSRLRSGRALRLEIHARGRRVFRTRAEAYRAGGEEGLSGILVRPEVENDLWRVLSEYSRVRYRAGRGPFVDLSLKGSTKAIASFLDDCRGIFGISAAADRDNEENNVDAAPSCRKFGSLKSVNSRRAVSIRFHNHTKGMRGVMWLDFKGQPVEYKNLNPGESYVQQTYVGHPWMFVDGPGNCLEIFVPRRGDRRFDITFE